MNLIKTHSQKDKNGKKIKQKGRYILSFWALHVENRFLGVRVACLWVRDGRGFTGGCLSVLSRPQLWERLPLKSSETSWASIYQTASSFRSCKTNCLETQTNPELANVSPGDPTEPVNNTIIQMPLKQHLFLFCAMKSIPLSPLNPYFQL